MDNTKTKNVKISVKHHEKLKSYCDDNGFKLYKVIEKWIDQNCTDRKRNLYNE
jgi:hypothetical protein